MKREIKFRGLRTDGKGWVYGSYDWNWRHINKYYIYELKDRKIIGHEVTNESVGQHTGLKDKNGNEIYEGDILHCHEYDSSDCIKRIIQTFPNAVVGFSNGSYYYYPNGNMNMPHQLLMYAYHPEVIGNIHEHKHLLK